MSKMHHMQSRISYADAVAGFNPAEKNRCRAKRYFFRAAYAHAGGVASIKLLNSLAGLTDEDTNFETANSLAQNKAMLVKHIEIDYIPGISMSTDGTATTDTTGTYAADIRAFFSSGILKGNLKGSDVFKDRLDRFPAGVRYKGHAALATTVAATTLVNEMLTREGDAYPLEWFMWQGGESIAATIEWPKAGSPVMPSGKDGIIEISFIGDEWEVR